MDFDEPDDPGEEMAPQQQNPGSGHRAKGSGGGKYRECLKNHAVGIGGHAVDGCGEFIPAGEEGTLDALRCAACTCHRNFHRKEPPEGGGGGGLASLSPAGGPGADFHHQFSPYYRTPAGYLHHHGGHPFMPQQQRAPAPLALPSTSGGAQSRGEEEELSDPTMMGLGGGGGPSGGGSSGKKRFRTKFTQEQKDKMLAFAERVGWRIQKQDEAAVQQLCNETAVKRHVLKVWMHNNKHTLVKGSLGSLRLQARPLKLPLTGHYSSYVDNGKPLMLESLIVHKVFAVWSIIVQLSFLCCI